MCLCYFDDDDDDDVVVVVVAVFFRSLSAQLDNVHLTEKCSRENE